MIETIATSNRTAVLGMGVTGRSCVRYLQSQQHSIAAFDSGMSVAGVDDFHRDYPDVPLFVGDFDGETLSQYTTLMVSPGISLEHPAIRQALQSGSALLSDIDVLVDAIAAPVVAITGSNGKTTVTTLLGRMAASAGLATAVAGNIGTPVLDLLADGDTYDLWVLELSSFQLERAAPLQARAATVLNLTPDHMDRYPNLLAYQQAKQRIYRGCSHVVFNRGDKLTWPLLTREQTSTSFGLDQPDLGHYGVRQRQGTAWLARGNDFLLPAAELKICGDHNVLNALAALALGEAAGLPLPVMLGELRVFPGVPHRCQWLGEREGVTFYNDSKGTNTGATLAAVSGLSRGDGDIILIAGGQGKGADFSALQAIVSQLRAVVLMGEAASDIASALGDAVPITQVETMEQAVTAAVAVAQPGHRVLLSPACASFDMFEGYAQRGEIFTALVQDYLEGAGNG